MSSPDQPASGPPTGPATGPVTWPQPEPPSSAYPYPTPPPSPPPAFPYGYPGYGYQPPVRPTNGLAIASLVISIAAFPAACVFYGVPGLFGAVGAVLGHVARRQIQRSGEGGDGLALAGVITGWVVTGLSLLAILAIGGIIVWAVVGQGTYP